ncbi:FVU4 protein [Dolichomitus sp. PSUC_FEM 10030005]|nr:FVU4 protein [Dolichomitus sp. PSUC_FEM 10030005]
MERRANMEQQTPLLSNVDLTRALSNLNFHSTNTTNTTITPSIMSLSTESTDNNVVDMQICTEDESMPLEKDTNNKKSYNFDCYAEDDILELHNSDVTWADEVESSCTATTTTANNTTTTTTTTTITTHDNIATMTVEVPEYTKDSIVRQSILACDRPITTSYEGRCEMHEETLREGEENNGCNSESSNYRRRAHYASNVMNMGESTTNQQPQSQHLMRRKQQQQRRSFIDEFTNFTDAATGNVCMDLPANVIVLDLQMCIYNNIMYPREYAICLIVHGQIKRFTHGLMPCPVEVHELSPADWHQNRYLSRDIHQLPWSTRPQNNISINNIITEYIKRTNGPYCFVIRGKQKETYLRRAIDPNLPIVILTHVFPLNCIPCKYHVYSPYTNRRCALFNLNFINKYVIQNQRRQYRSGNEVSTLKM